MIRDLIYEIWQNLCRNRTRTILSGLAVVWGIFMLVLLLGMANGVLNTFTASSAKENLNLINVFGSQTRLPYKGLAEGRNIALLASDREKLIADNPSTINDVVLRNSMTVANITSQHGSSVSGGQLSGVYPEYIGCQPIDMVEGRYINLPDIENRRKVMVMERGKARQLFGDSATFVGRNVEVMGSVWTIVGIYTHRWISRIYVPFTTLNSLTGNSPEVEELVVISNGLTGKEDAMEFEEMTVKSLAKTHNFDPEERSPGAVYVVNRMERHLDNLQAFSMMQTALWVLGLLMLLTGIVGISNIMFVSVKERTHEIGIRRAIGAKPRRILLDIIAESVVITLIFGYIGIVLGMIATEIIGNIPQVKKLLENPGVDLSLAFEVMITLVIAGALAGFFPALKATKVRPVEALRDE